VGESVGLNGPGTIPWQASSLMERSHQGWLNRSVCALQVTVPCAKKIQDESVKCKVRRDVGASPYAARLRSHRCFSASLPSLHVIAVEAAISMWLPIRHHRVPESSPLGGDLSLRSRTYPISQGLKK